VPGKKIATLRYQHASEIRTDLQRLKRDTESHRVRSRCKGASNHHSYCRALEGDRSRCAVLAIVIAGTSICTGRFRPRQTHGQGTIVLADFINTTGDPCLTGRFAKGWPYSWNSRLSSASSPRANPEGAPSMGRAGDARLTPDLAREICERTVAPLSWMAHREPGSQYVLGCAPGTAARDVAG